MLLGGRAHPLGERDELWLVEERGDLWVGGGVEYVPAKALNARGEPLVRLAETLRPSCDDGGYTAVT